MKFWFFILSNFILYIASFAQKTNQYEYIGALRTLDNQIISYKLIFQETSKGIIEGVSYTDFYGNNNTESKIKGTLSNNNLLSFKELNNIRSSSTEDEEIFCYIHVNNLKIRRSNSKRIINGEFVGIYPNGDSCASGSIYLVSNAFLEKLNINNDSLKKIDSLLKNTKSSPIQILKHKDHINLAWSKNEIVVNIWDGYKEDNDVVDIYFNNVLIKENFIITNKVQEIIIPFEQKQGSLKVVAVDEGKSPINTVNFILSNNKDLNFNSFQSTLIKDEFIEIFFKRE